MTKKYYVLDDVKTLLNIADTDEADDELLDQFGIKADKVVDNAVSDVLTTYPITSDSSIGEDLAHASNLYTSMLYKLQNKDYEAVKTFKELYKDVIDGIRKRYVSSNETRSQRTIVKKDYITEPLQSDPLL